MGFAELAEVDPREFRVFAGEFSDIVRTLPFQLPENFILIMRAMSLTSGISSSLNPAFNIWDAVEPYSAQLIAAEGGNLVRDLAARATTIASTLARLPQRIEAVIDRAEEGNLAVRSPALEKRVASLDRTGRRLVSAVLFAALLIAGVILRSDDVVFGTVLMAASGLPLLHALLAGLFLRR